MRERAVHSEQWKEEIERKYQSFDALDLFEIAQRQSQERVLLTIDNKEFSLEFNKEIQGKKKDDKKTEYQFNLTPAENKSSYIMLDITVHEDKNQIATAIEKSDANKEFPKGFGFRMYVKGLEFIQAYVNQGDKSHVHKISYAPTLSDRGTYLTLEEWKKIFKPIIENGYQMLDDRQWEKVYYPENNKK